VFAKCNNQSNRQMGYVGEIQQSTSKQKLIIFMVTSHVIVTSLI
jgi:hypothetical protein